MASTEEEPTFYVTPSGNLTNAKVIPLEHEAWIAEELDNPRWKSLLPNPSWFYLAEDMWTAELPTQKHVLLSAMRMKGRGNTPVYAAIKVGSGIISKPPQGIETKIWIVAEIQVCIL